MPAVSSHNFGTADRDLKAMTNNIPENLERELLAQEEPNTPMLGEVEEYEDNRVDDAK